LAGKRSHLFFNKIINNFNNLPKQHSAVPKIVCHNSAVSSKFRIAASRANGAKSRGPVTDAGKRIAALNSIHSTGPVTPEGKVIASQNATRHGLLADSLVLDGESEARFCSLLASLERELDPGSSLEDDQIAIMAVAQWRRMRLWSLEKASYIEETRRRRAANQAAGQAAGQADDPACDGETPITHLARTFRTLADESNVLHLLNRYETRFSREYLRALACIGNLRAAREQRQRESQSEERRRQRAERQAGRRNQSAADREIQ
jgi:hypothetical protein